MHRVEIEFTSHPDEMGWHVLIEERLLPLAREAGCDELAIFGLQLALVEAVNNVIEHAYAMQSGGVIGISGEQREATLCFELRDQGVPMPMPLPSGEPAPTDAAGGRGWQIIRANFPTVEYARLDGSNLLTLCRPLPAEQ
jgi:serine/threonine-protein kinase RsbW